MKLALVRQRYNPYGGAERFVERALGALAEQNLHVTLITREWQGAQDGRDVRICNPFHVGRLWRDASFGSAVQRIVASGEFDLVQSHERIPGCGIYRAGDGVHATWLELRAQIQTPAQRLATRLHPWHRYILRAESDMFRHPALRAVICNSEMVKRDIAARFGVAESKMHVIHNGVDLDFFHPGLRNEHRSRMRRELSIGEATPVVLFVGSGFERKGVPQLLQALARMQHRDAVAVIVGKDKRSKAIQALAQQLGLAGRIHFVGAQKDVRPYYGMADAFALPTLYDPFPNAALEALACGLPVMTTTTSGAAEILNADCGAVCDALDVAGQATALDRLLSLAHASGNAPRNAVQCYGVGDMTARLTALYADLLRA